MKKKLPIGIQSFEKLRTDGFLYVDKTDLIYQLVHNNAPYFFSRPRRFGKSLLLSALKAYWEGKKELFSDLKISKLEQNHTEAWRTYPVLYFDFNGVNYQDEEALERKLRYQLQEWEQKYHCDSGEYSLEERFGNVIKKASEETGLRTVILIDEYDKPLLDVVNHPALQEHNKEVFKGFFGTMKSLDAFIQFVFITGVTKFHKVSIFSDLNQLRDISLSKQYAALCGITEEELRRYFAEEIASFAGEQKLPVEECLTELKCTYDGYRFHQAGESVYNPFSLLSALEDQEFGSYWFATGTPTFLVRKLRIERFDVRSFTDHTIYADESTLKDYTGDSLDAVPLLYQTGYLTIVDYDSRRRRYTLSFPNEEVKYGFLAGLLPEYVPVATVGNKLDIYSLDEFIENGDLGRIRDYLIALFAGIPYTTEAVPFEHDFQSVIYVVFTLLGKFVICEMHTFSGRIDCIVETERYIYLFEFKRDETAENALKQIENKGYALPYASDSRKLYKIGVGFDSKTRKLTDWKVRDDSAVE